MTDRKFGVAVGYGRPPVSTQFKKGQSGNAKGRTKGSDALSLLIPQICQGARHGSGERHSQEP